MTVFSNVKGTLAAAKTIQAEFSRLAESTSDDNAKRIFHECMEDMDSVIYELNHRVEFMKAEEQQYRNS
ncbi:DUF1657 domain-containing protein [Lederbergia sp. NSJ-179]|uniref:DUF1657 domain-containing protein n=1 Tax=Lederbergia sp. NSJ-179 TaxID=2931402 RepID=UPI001FCF7B5C|nr:DUF1657 domain-containing protein [Lederbergia sp. NSJ-179]MCJ7841183.1 DUF1657 domain-containing protein [Lederbergia sp. NSJ-179]